jgi:ketosteroid isomerase-like protein
VNLGANKVPKNAESYGSEDFLELFHPDVDWSVAPTGFAPHGERGNRESLRNSLVPNAAVLRNRNIEIDEIVESGNVAAWTAIYTSNVGVDGLTQTKGTQLRVHMAVITEVKNGLIVRHREYVCAPEDTDA